MWDAVLGIVKMAIGGIQASQGQAGLSSLQRPTYKRPGEINQMTSLAGMEYADPYMPGEGIAMDRIDQSTQKAFDQSAISGNPLGAIAAIQAQDQAAKQNMAMQSAQYQKADLESYYRALQAAAPYTDMEFQMNQFAPFAEKSQEYRDMIGAGTKNLYGGAQDIGGVADAWMNQGLKTSNGGKGSGKGNTDAIYERYNNGGMGGDEYGQFEGTNVGSDGGWNWDLLTTG